MTFLSVIIVGIVVISFYTLVLLGAGLAGLIKLIAKAIAKRKEDRRGI